MKDEIPYYALLAVLSWKTAAIADVDYLWIDERITRRIITEYDFVGIFVNVTANQPHYPTYYLLGNLLGFAGLRWLSIAAFAATAILTTFVARELYGGGNRVWVAGAIVALSPYLARQASWHRMYAVVTFGFTLVLYLVLTKRRLEAAIVAVLMTVLHPLGVLSTVFVVIEALVSSNYAIAWGGAIASAGPVGWFYMSHTVGGKITQTATNLSHTTAPRLVEAAVLPAIALVGTALDPLRFALALTLLSLVLYPKPDWHLVVYIFVPVAFIFAFSILVYPIYRPKYIGFLGPAVAVLIVSPGRSQLHRWFVRYFLIANYALMWLPAMRGWQIARHFPT